MGSSIFNFERLDVYNKSLAFSIIIYKLTQTWPREHLFGITNQIRRASLSIGLNIAEGYSRTRKDFQHFLTISRGSCFECVPLLRLANSIDLINQSKMEELLSELEGIAQMTSKLRTVLFRNSNPETRNS